MRESLEALEASGMPRDPLLDAVHIPEGFEYLYLMFWEIRGGASEGMSGTRVTWRDLESYTAITGIALDAFEVEAIMAMDGALQAAITEAS